MCASSELWAHDEIEVVGEGFQEEERHGEQDFL